MTHPLRATAQETAHRVEYCVTHSQFVDGEVLKAQVEDIIEAALADVQRAAIQQDAKWMQHLGICDRVMYRSGPCSCGLTARLTEGG